MTFISAEILKKFESNNIKQILYNSANCNISLLAGNAGIVLVLSVLAKVIKKDYLKSFNYVLERLVSDIQKGNHRLSPTFCDGLAGVGWLFSYLNDIEMVSINDTSFFNEFDKYLSEQLDTKISEYDHDQLHGAIGIALYFISRQNQKEVGKLIEYFSKNKHQFKNQFLWQRRIKNRETNRISRVFDLGLAHGNAGVLHFLIKCIEVGIREDQCQYLLEGCLNFYLNNIQNIDDIGSFFAPQIYKKNKKLDKTPQFSRLAWCYGDGGILLTLYIVCKKLKFHKYLNDIEEMFVKISQRKTFVDTGIVDFGFCHGAIGVAIIFRIIFDLTKNDILGDAAKHWEIESYKYLTGELLVCDRKDNNYKQFHFNEAKGDILDGISGVALLHCLKHSIHIPENNSIHKWREVLFLK